MTDLHKPLTERARQGLAHPGDGAGIRTDLRRGVFPLALPGVVIKAVGFGKGRWTLSSVSVGRSLSLPEPRFLCLRKEAQHACRGSERMTRGQTGKGPRSGNMSCELRYHLQTAVGICRVM